MTHTTSLHYYSFNGFDCGGRLCTCLVYLNDSEQSIIDDYAAETLSRQTSSSSAGDNKGVDCGDEEEETTTTPLFTGGETNFPEFNTAISPKKGSALFFWNTLEKPGSKDYTQDMFLNVDRKLRHAGK